LFNRHKIMDGEIAPALREAPEFGTVFNAALAVNIPPVGFSRKESNAQTFRDTRRSPPLT
jgi:hypothetical protein